MDQSQSQCFATGSNTIADLLIISQSCSLNLTCYQDMIASVDSQFTDEEFKANSCSIAKIPETSAKAQKCVWLRAQDIFPTDYKVFQHGIKPTDIKQGQLGDCYFLSTLCSMAGSSPQLIKNLFIEKNTPVHGIYGVWLCFNGEWRQVFVDDFFPCDKKTKKPYFSKAVENELWVLLLEKAYSKLFGSYEQIELGYSCQAFRDLTGAPALDFNRKNETPEEGSRLFQIIYDNLAHKNIITTTSERNEQGMETQNANGLVSSHCYSILGCRRVQDSEGVDTELIKIRNPWGNKEWSGDWSDKSAKWTPQLIADLNIVSAEDGIFWMNSQDFIKEFNMITVGYYHPKYYFSSFRFKDHPTAESVCVAKIINPSDNNHCYISISQTDKRAMGGKASSKQQLIKLILVREDGEQKFIDAKFDDKRDVFIDVTLEAGEYALYVEVQWAKNQTVKDLVLSTYSADIVKINHHEGYQNGSDLLALAFKLHSNSKLAKVYEYKPDLTRSMAFVGGFLYFYYVNNSEFKLKEELILKNYKLMSVCAPHTEIDHNEIVVNEGQTELVVFKVLGSGGYSYSYSTKYNITQ